MIDSPDGRAGGTPHSAHHPARHRDLEGVEAVITGASGGIGAGISLALAARGAHVVCLGRSRDRLAQVVAAVEAAGGHVTGRVGDIRDRSFLEDVIGEHPGLGILVNNAGINHRGPLLSCTPEQIDEILSVDLAAAIHASQLAARAMVAAGTNGVIVSISSTLGHVGGVDRAVYAAAKHGLEGFSKSIAMELAEHGIRAVTVAPTFVETEMIRRHLDDAGFRAQCEASIPMGRIASIDEVVGAVDFLTSPGAGMITGSSIRVDGGYAAGQFSPAPRDR